MPGRFRTETYPISGLPERERPPPRQRSPGELRTETFPIDLLERGQGPPAPALAATAPAGAAVAAAGAAPAASAAAFTPPPAAEATGEFDTSPPVDAADLENRKAGWKSFITGVAEKFQTDPDFRSFMFNFGTRMMQPFSEQQTALGHVGASLQGAQNYSGALAAQRAAGAQSAGKLGLEERKVAETERRGKTQSVLDLSRAEAALRRAGALGGVRKDMNRADFVAVTLKDANFYFEKDATLGEITDALGKIWDRHHRGGGAGTLSAADLLESRHPSAEQEIGTEADVGEETYVNTASGWVLQ